MNEEMLAEFMKKYGPAEDYGDSDKYRELLGAFVVGWKVALGVAELKLRSQLAAANARADAAEEKAERIDQLEYEVEFLQAELARVRAALSEQRITEIIRQWVYYSDSFALGVQSAARRIAALAAPVTPSPNHPAT